MTSFRQMLAGCAWVLASVIAWLGVANGVGWALDYLINERQVPLPPGIATAFNFTMIAGLILLPALVILLWIREKLPGTRPTRPTPHGFPIEPTPPPNQT